MNQYLHTFSIFPQLCNKQYLECEKCITEIKIFEALKRIPNGKSPRNDGLIKAFFETLSPEVKTCIFNMQSTLFR